MGGAVDAWLTGIIGTVVGGVFYANEQQVFQATWPYMTNNAADMTSKGFQGIPSDNTLFSNYTPNTTQLGFINISAQVDANRTTLMGSNYATGTGTGQNGYSFGNLTGYEVDADGVLRGIYSNGVTLGLYQVTLYDFTSRQGLRRDGGNLFSETRESGAPYFGPANTYGFGKLVSYAIEASNVDMAREFVQMITTQRGFQANSRVVTTTDTMLEAVIQMKR
jgi:flagellar hook protein FlgE